MRGISTAFALFATSLGARALSLDLNDPDSIKSAASALAAGVIAPYDGNKTGQIPGMYGKPYGWWAGAIVWDAMVDYWYLTGDDTYNGLVEQALLWQAGDNVDYLPVNWTNYIGNDDQSSWAFAALTAAERNFTAPSRNVAPEGANLTSWTTLAVNVFDEQAARWDTERCGGGLRWQLYPYQAGYTYKNAMSNGQFFALAARLGRLTGNSTYLTWADTTYAWMVDSGLLTDDGRVYDTVSTLDDCEIGRLQWTSNAGAVLLGSAAMAKATGNSTWTNRTTSILGGIGQFFLSDNGVITEAACEGNGQCNTDMLFYKGMLARDLAAAATFVPSLNDSILPLVQKTAQAAAENGCSDVSKCSFGWDGGEDPPNSVGGLGSEYSALQFVQQNLAFMMESSTSTGAGSSGVSGTSSPSGSSSTPGATGTSASGSGSPSGTGSSAGASSAPTNAASTVRAFYSLPVAALGSSLVAFLYHVGL